MTINLPTGQDLLRLLQHAYPTDSYALYGTEVNQILGVPNLSNISIPEENTLVWSGINPPTKEQISTAWASYKNHIEPNPVQFEADVYADLDLRSALFRANPMAFTILVRLLGAEKQTLNMPNIQEAIGAIRGSMSPDFTAAQLSRLANYAQKNGLLLTFT